MTERSNNMAKKSSLFKPLMYLSLLPAAALLLKKHASVKTGDRTDHIYTVGKKDKPGGAVFITNQTPSGLAKKIVKKSFTSKR